MAAFRQISTQFWSDPKVQDEMSPEDRYFYLYLMTNPHTNSVGCYEVSKRQMSNETGYTIETIEKLLSRMNTVHDVIMYENETKEVLLKNWYKYNWFRSPKFEKRVVLDLDAVKAKRFREYLDTVCIGYGYGMHRVSNTGHRSQVTGHWSQDTNTDTFSAADDAGEIAEDVPKDEPKEKPKRSGRKSAKVEIDLSFIADKDVRSSFAEFAEHRNQMKKPLTQLAAEKAYKQLAGLYPRSNDQIAAIDNAIAKGWQGIYPMDDRNGKAKGGFGNGSQPENGAFRTDTALPY